MNVWKIGSRWSESGTPESSVLDVFRKYNILFIGTQGERANAVSINDIVAVSDGLKVVSVGRVLETPRPVTEYSFDEEDLKTYEESDREFYYPSTTGFRVKLFDLEEYDIFQYTRGTIHKANKHWNNIISLYERYESLGHDTKYVETMHETYVNNLREILGDNSPNLRGVFDCWSAEWNFVKMNEKVSIIEKLAKSHKFPIIIDDYKAMQKARGRNDIADAIPRSLAHIISALVSKNK